MFELANWGNEIFEGATMSETIVVGGLWCEFVPVMDSWMIVGGIGYHLTPDGEWSADIPNSEDFHPTEAAAREFARQFAEPAEPAEAGGVELPTNGVDLIAAERQRQVSQEGWTPEHDDEHRNGEMSRAAIAYTLFSYVWGLEYLRWWPWEPSWWKPDAKNTVRNLTKAGALIAAEIDRLLRLRGNWHPTPATEVAELRAKLDELNISYHRVVGTRNELQVAIVDREKAMSDLGNEIAELRADVERLRDDIAGQEAISRGSIRANLELLDEIATLTTERDALRGAAKNALHYMRLHKYADQAWADDLEAALAPQGAADDGK